MENNRISFLEYVPISIFGAVMGICGLSFAWKLASHLWNVPEIISSVIGTVAILLFLVLTVLFLVKLKKFPAVLRNEFNHPVSVSFFATIIISLLLIPGLLLPVLPFTAKLVWTGAAVLMFAFAWYVLRKWLDHQQAAESAIPAWVIPVVGTLDVPIVGSSFHSAWAHETCLVFFGVGCVFAIILLTIIFARLLFQGALPDAVQPTLLILLGPCALVFSGYERLTGQVDLFSSVVFYFNLFLLLLLASKVVSLPKVCPFYVSWWSVSFPLSATTISALRYADHQPTGFHQIIAGILLLITSIVILFLLFQSLYRITNGTFASSAPQPATVNKAAV
jgi:tellurite resistance protein